MEIFPKGNSLEGILHYFYSTNPSTYFSFVQCESSSVWNNEHPCINVINFCWTCPFHSDWEDNGASFTINLPFTCFILTHYTIQSFPSWEHNRIPRGWKVESSENGLNWIKNHVIQNTNDIIYPGSYRTYECLQTYPKFIKFTMLGSSTFPCKYFVVNHIEIFGVIVSHNGMYFNRSYSNTSVYNTNQCNTYDFYYVFVNCYAVFLFVLLSIL